MAEDASMMTVDESGTLSPESVAVPVRRGRKPRAPRAVREEREIREVSPGDESREHLLSGGARELAAEWDDWQPTRFTAAPPPLDGFEQRWVRHRMGGGDDLQNYLRRAHQGWRPRPADTLPASYRWMKQTLDAKFGEQGDVIGNQDSILMHRPIHIGDHYRHEMRERNSRLSGSIKEYVSGKMPASYGTSGGEVEELKISRSSGQRVPRIADDPND